MGELQKYLKILIKSNCYRIQGCEDGSRMEEKISGGANERYVRRDIRVKIVCINNYNNQGQQDGYRVIKFYPGDTNISEYKDGQVVRRLTEAEVKAFGIPEKLEEEEQEEEYDQYYYYQY